MSSVRSSRSRIQTIPFGRIPVIAIVFAAVLVCGGFSAQAAVSIVTYGSSTASGAGYNLTVPAGQTADCVVVIVHTCDLDLTNEAASVTVGGTAATAITGGLIWHNGVSGADDVKLESFYRSGTWTSGTTIPVAWTWAGGTAPADYVVGAYALKGVSSSAQPFQNVQIQTGGNGGVRAITLPSLTTSIDGSVVLWAYTSDNQSDAAATAAPALTATPVNGWQVSDTGGTTRLRAEAWHGTATNANNAEVLGTSNGNGRVVMLGLSMLPTFPVVTSIVRNGSTPTSAGTVSFTVTFSQAVTGVGTDDFTVSTTGTIAGTSIASVSADSGTTRTVTVNTGTGTGNLRLDVTDNDSIMNAETNALGGPGTGNGNFTLGESYSIDKTPPSVSSIVRTATNPSNAAWIYFFVTFSEPVTGVGTSDFTLSSSGVAGAYVASVSPDTAETRTVVVSTGTGSGTIRLDVTDNDSIVDGVSNPLGGAGTGNGNYTGGEVYTIDKLPPYVNSITRSASSPTNASSVTYTVTFSESVTGVGLDDFVLTTTGGIADASVSGVSADTGLTRTVTVNTGSGTGTIRLDVTDNDSIVDVASNTLAGTPSGNGNFTTGEVYTIDRTPPSVSSVLRNGDDPTNASSVSFTITFSEPVMGVGIADIVLSTTGVNGAAITGISADALSATRTVTVNTGTGDGTIRLDVLDDDSIGDVVANPLGGAGAGNGAYSTGQFYTVDKTPPVVTSILREGSDPTSATYVNFDVTFSEAVQGVGMLDFTLSSTGVSGASITGVSADSLSTTRVITVYTGVGDGTIRLDLTDDDSVVDAAMNALGGAGTGNGDYTSGQSYTVDKTAPIATVTGPLSPTNLSVINFSVSFPESVTGLTADGFTVTGGTKGTLTGNGAGPYVLAVTPAVDGPVTCRVNAGAARDAANNGNPMSDTVTVQSDQTAPIPTLTGPASPSNASPISFSVSFPESVTGLTADGFTVTGGTKGTLTGSGSGPYTLPVTPATDGPVTCRVEAGMAHDEATNLNPVSITLTIQSDRTVPIPTLTGPASPTNASPINFSVSFAESVTGLSKDGFTVTGGTKGTVTGSGSGPYILPVTPTADGAVTCQVNAGAAQDNAANGNSVSEVVSVQSDRTAPIPTVSGPASPSNASPITFSISFLEPVTGLTADEITVTGGTKGALMGSAAGPYTLPVTPTADGAVTCQVPAGAVQDTANNGSTVSNNLLIMSDRTPPAIGIAAPSVSITNGGPVTYEVEYEHADTITLVDANVNLLATGTAAGTVHISGSEDSEREVTISGITGTGTLGISIKPGTASDLAGNLAPGSDPSQTFNVDNTPPQVTVNALGTTNDTTPTLSGTVSDNVAVASVEVLVDHHHSYSAQVNGGAWNVQVADPLTGIPPTAYEARVDARDTAGNTATTTSSFTVDSTAPTKVDAVTLTGASPTNDASVDFEVIFSLGVGTVVAGDFALTTTGGITGASITNVAGSDETRTVTVNTGAGDGSIRLDVVDRDTILDLYSHPLGGTGLGNGDFSAGQVYVVDKTPPSVSLSTTAHDPTNLSSFPVVVTFTENVVGFVKLDLVLGNATITNFMAISPTEYHFNMNPVSEGLVTADVFAGVAYDAVGNGNEAAVQFTRTYDITPPTVVIGPPSVPNVRRGSVSYDVTYEGADLIDLGPDNVHLVATGTAAATVYVSGGKSAAVRTVTLDDITGMGSLAISLDAGTAMDDAGNLDLGPSVQSEAVTVSADLPVGGIGAIVFLSAACAFSGLRIIRRKK